MRRIRRAATLPVSFFNRPAEQVARELLGTRVISLVDGERTIGRIVETEAYLGYDDPASHGYRHRRNQRNAALFGSPGTWYVYLSYGMHWCANLVCEEEGKASAVLLRALEPLEGIEMMRHRRGCVADRELCSGPGKLCQALGITRSLDGASMSNGLVLVAPPEDGPPPVIVTSPRIGITKAADWPLRFTVAGSTWISRRGWDPGRPRAPRNPAKANGQRK
jgi:DNA-3-methyladenine glycosylase